MVNALRWLATYLETRFPAKVDPAILSTKDEVRILMDIVDSRLAGCAKEIDSLKKQIEILNLRVGLTRPTQAAFGRKLNG